MRLACVKFCPKVGKKAGATDGPFYCNYSSEMLIAASVFIMLLPSRQKYEKDQTDPASFLARGQRSQDQMWRSPLQRIWEVSQKSGPLREVLRQSRVFECVIITEERCPSRPNTSWHRFSVNDSAPIFKKPAAKGEAVTNVL
jgi:hypothetical protein